MGMGGGLGLVQALLFEIGEYPILLLEYLLLTLHPHR
jgi:hypothetical protein